MQKPRLKTLLWTLPLICLLLTFLFWQQTLSFLVEYSFRSYCRDCLQSELSAEKIVKSDWTIAYENAQLVSSDMQVHLEAKELILKFEPRLLEREIDLYIKLIDPNIDLKKMAPVLYSLLSRARTDWGLLKINHKVQIDDGILDDGMQAIHFTVDHDFIKSNQMQLVANFGTNDHENKITLVMKQPAPKQVELEINCHQVCCKALSRTLEALFPTLSSWEIQEGLLNGDFSVKMAKHQEPLISSKFDLQKFVAELKPFGIAIMTPQVHVDYDRNRTSFIQLKEPATMSFNHGGQKHIEFKDLIGKVVFSKSGVANLDAEGLCVHHDTLYSAHFTGENNGQEASLGLLLEASHRHGVGLNLAVRDQEVEIEVKNFSPEEFDIIQTFFGAYSSNVHVMKMRRGALDAVLLTPLDQSKIQKLKLVSLNVDNVSVDFIPWNMTLEADQIAGHFGADLFAENFLKTFDAQVSIKNGTILPLEGLERPLFSHIHTNLTIEKGLIRDSLVYGTFAGLEGNMQINWNAPHDLLSLNFAGGAEHLLSLIPQNFRERFEDKFKHDNIALEAHVTRIMGKKRMECCLTVSNDASDRNDAFSFAFDLEASDDLLKVNLPKRTYILPDTFYNHGSFSAKHVDLQKYVSLLLFPDKKLILKGYGDFEGTFDSKGITLHYNAKNLNLENAHFVIDLKEIKDAFGYFPLEEGNIDTSIKIENGTYFEKGTGLLFTDINASLALKDQCISIPTIDTFCNGVYFAGNMLLDLSNPQTDLFSLEIKAHTMKGKFSQVQHLFSHFNKPFFFVKMPFEGDVSFRKEGWTCRFDFKPDSYDFQTVLQGCISEGRMQSENFDVAVEALSLDFDYDHQQNQFNLTDIQGALLVGKPDRAEEYMIAGDHIRFTDYRRNEGDFDVWIGDRNRDIIRLAGKMVFPNIRKEGDFVEFLLNQDLSHFGDVHLNGCQLILKDWADVEVCKLEFAFKLDTLFRDLQRFSHTGFLFLSPKLLERLNAIETAKGEFAVAIDYDQKHSLLNYHLKGKDLAIADYQFNQCLLEGKRAHHTWIIDQFLLDNLSIAADIFYDEGDCKINFLGLQLGSALLAGMDGVYDRPNSCFKGHVNLLEIDLAKLNDWPLFQPFVEKLSPQGQVKGVGQLQINFDKEPDWHAEAALNATLKNLQLKNLKFQDAEGISCQVTSDKGMILRRIKTGLKCPRDQSIAALLEVDKAEYDYLNDAFYLEGMHFNVPVKKLTTVTGILGSTFPETFKPQILDVCSSIKRTGNVEGTINVDIAEPHHAIKLTLKEDKYIFRDQEHELNNFVLDLDPCEFKIVTQYRYQQKLFWALINSKSPNLDFGRLVLLDQHPDQQVLQHVSPLIVYWRNYPETGLSIETAEGHFSGLQVNLYRNADIPLVSDAMHLEGEVYANMRDACGFLSPDIAQKISAMEIGQGYCLKGSYVLSSHSCVNDLYFQGNLFGKDCELQGYQFQHLQADVILSPESISVKNIHLEDPCGVLYSDIIYLEKQRDASWTCSSPAVRIADFRPSMLREAGYYSIAPSKPFVVRQLVLHNLNGCLGQAASFSGYGSLDFANPHKKNFHNPLFVIPAEIIARIGLDPSVLTPVIGTVNYEIRDGKVILTRFKDVYSEGRHSKFYLSSNPAHESSMDFDGNLNVHVRMKQYNLLFKIAELLTVKVEGNLKKPTYSLNKQQKTPPLRS